MDKKLFLQTFLQSPSQVGSIIPSSRFMVRKITNLVDNANPSSVAEFGAGTGVITRQLNQLCQEKNIDLYVFEKDDRLRQYLSEQFPQLDIYSDALLLPDVMKEKGLNQVDCIVCGLPFTLFPPELREKFFNLIYSSLAEKGTLIMFQFSLHMLKTLKQQYRTVDVKFIPLNVPPAFVYHCQK
jgi:phospholipid N-methyltransferase